MNIKWSLMLLVSIMLVSCSKQQRKSLNLDSLPNALGNAFQVLVVTDESLNETELADSILYGFTGPYLIVPVPEPVLDLDYLASRDFTGYLKHRRTIMIIGTLDGDNYSSKLVRAALGAENIRKAKESSSFRYAVQENKYAKGQQVFYIFAPTTKELPDAISRSSAIITNKIYTKDNIISKASAYAGGLNKEVINDLKSKMNLSLNVPSGYKVTKPKMLKDSTVWLRYETKEIDYHLLIKSFGYGSEKDLTKENLLKMRNSIGEKYISTGAEGSYMTTEEANKPKPIFKMTKFNNNLALEGRGLWKTVGDYMGGAFISYLVYNPNNNRIVFVEGFLYAPKKQSQKEYVERLNSILKTLKF